jgi:hypothetical protein
MGHLKPDMLLMAIGERFPDDGRELSVFVQRFRPVLLEFLELLSA